MTKNIQLISKALHLPMVFPTSQNRSLSTRVLAALFICLAISFPMGAQAGEKEQNQGQGHEETAGVTSLQIQLRPIMAPITGASQYYAPITLFIEAVSKDHILKICHYRPLIVDAVLQVLSRQPIPVIRRKLDLRNIPAQVLAPINIALGAEIVRAVYVVPGAHAKGYNTGLFRVSASSCKIIEDKAAETKKSH